MSEFLDRISKLSPQRLALLADELNERLQDAERSRYVPLAVVGIGCRLPGGVQSPEEFWTLLRNGIDAVGEVPASRWDTAAFYDSNPDTPGKMSTHWGGFIDAPDQFDPKFFGIAPAEAASMDPQQRLLLETTWESLEHAGIAPTSLSGTRTGVFIGLCNADYGQVALNQPRESITPYLASGLSHAIAAGRISYVLGLQGPSLAIDTSCSASLVAVHLACQSLRLGECDAALAGGVNLILNPDITIALSQSRMMAPDGKCKAFSDNANGFVR
ncbi:MAG: polyketide synthase, partial [Acidobacteriaceae bacterium]